VLLDAPDLDGTVKKSADVVERGVRRIQHIVADLLDVSREREGAGISIEPRTMDLQAMCRQLIDEVEAIARDRKVVFECDAEGSGAWDEQRLLQAISNLTSNAVQHGAPGSPIRLRLTGDEQRVSIEVHNEGTIPAELLPRIFQPFHSGRHRGRRGDGLGLGLFIARAIARAHGGALEVDSTGGSTMFRLLLPRRAPASSYFCEGS
jgi:signal transduction histidine kinase